jgi:LuxR family maltose regulon positive regulatory protein
MQGMLHQALETHRDALQLGARPGKRPVPFAGMAYVGIAMLLYEWNDLEAALHYAREGIGLSEMGGRVSYVLAGRTVLALVYQARGEVGRAFETIRKVEELAQRHGHPYVMAEMAELRIRLWIAQGNLVTASQWALEYDGSVFDEGIPPLAHEMQQIAMVRVLIARALSSASDEPSRAGLPNADEIDDALGHLEGLLDGAEASGRARSVIKILALQALAFQAQGDQGRAMSALGRALFLAEPEGYVRTFVDEGEPISMLLRSARAQGLAPSYVASLLAVLGEAATPVPPEVQPLVEPLTERELEVLCLIAAGLSNQEIAQELVIAVSTVKSHINHVYGKMGVKSRTQAVARAQSLGML